MQTSPFKRARAMMILVASAMGLATEADRRIALSNIGPYESRGHGSGRYLGSSKRTTAQGKRAAIKARNRARNKAAHRG